MKFDELQNINFIITERLKYIISRHKHDDTKYSQFDYYDIDGDTISYHGTYYGALGYREGVWEEFDGTKLLEDYDNYILELVNNNTII